MKILLLILLLPFTAQSQVLDSWHWSPKSTIVVSDTSKWRTVETLGDVPMCCNPEWVYSDLYDCFSVTMNSNTPYFKSTCRQRRIDKVSGTVQKRNVEVIYKEERDNCEYEKTVQLFIK